MKQRMKQNNHLTVYNRDGCHLCEDMLSALYWLQDELNLTIESIDIDDNPLLREKYNDDVPVVSFNNEILFCHFIDEKRLRSAIMTLNG